MKVPPAAPAARQGVVPASLEMPLPR
jgi:hypothetical protein